MKKTILFSLALCSLIMCNKPSVETATDSSDSVNVENEDNAAAKIDSVSAIPYKKSEEITPSVNLEEIKNTVNNTKKSIDSISSKASKIVDHIDENIDKVNEEGKKIEKVIASKEAPKVVKEKITKIIYKEKPAEPKKIITPKLIKDASVEMEVEDIDHSTLAAKDILYKNNISIKTEHQNANEDQDSYELTARIPYQSFEFVMENLYSLGQIKNKNIEILADEYGDNSYCNLSLKLTEKNEKKAEASLGFWDKFSDSISSGWDFILNLFLWLLPFWPLFLAIGVGYYFYKKKQNQRNPKPSQNS